MTENTRTMLLDMLVEQLDNEPPGNAGDHPSTELHERAGAAWAAWDRHVEASRLLLGSLLVNEAIEQHRERRKQELRDALEERTDELRDALAERHTNDQKAEPPVVTSEFIRSSPPGSTWSNPDTDAVFEWTGDRLAKHIAPYSLSNFDSIHAVDIDGDWYRSAVPPVGEYTEGTGQ